MAPRTESLPEEPWPWQEVVVVSVFIVRVETQFSHNISAIPGVKDETKAFYALDLTFRVPMRVVECDCVRRKRGNRGR